MAVTVQYSAEFTNHNAALPIYVPSYTWRGRLRVAYFRFTQSGAGDANSTAELVHLPAGKIRVLGNLSTIYFDAFGAARTLDVGYRAHTNEDGTAVAEDEDFFATAVDVSAAGSAVLDEAGSAARAALLDSTEGVDIYAKVEGGTIPDTTVLEGFIVYVVD